jgi:hypothetical protein
MQTPTTTDPTTANMEGTVLLVLSDISVSGTSEAYTTRKELERKDDAAGHPGRRPAARA